MTLFNPFYQALADVGFTDPVHPALAHIPIGLVVGALIFGFVALIWQRPRLGLSARHCLVLAWLFIFPTALFGVMDWQHFYHGAWLFPIKAKIGLASFLFVVLSGGLMMILKGQGESKVMLVIYVLAFFAVVGLGYFGGRLVFAGQAPAGPESSQAGGKIFDANCRSCHPDGGNVVMPKLPIRGSVKLANFQTFVNFIRQPRLPDGSKGAMPAWPPTKISDQEARVLYDYVKQAFGGAVIPPSSSVKTGAAQPPGAAVVYNPPAPESAPADIKEAVRLGYNIVNETKKYAGEYVGNALSCTNCHFKAGLTRGGKNGGLSLVGVGATYPTYKKRENYAVDLVTRTNDCFERSMNGKPLPASGKEMTAIATYFQWISKGLPIYAEIPWLGLPLLASSHQPNPGEGNKVLTQSCSVCHGGNGEGTPAGPPLWGPNSFNDGAGLARLKDFAAFVHLNMPQNNPTLTEAQALDVASYVTAQPRPHFHKKMAATTVVSRKATAGPELPAFQPLPRKPPIPKDNPMTAAKVELGKQLYFDERLSINGTVSCQSCHDAMGSGTSPLPVPYGVYGKLDGHRNDPTVWNAAFKTAQFWDGRAPSLEEQAKGPLFNPVEMGNNPETLVSRIKQIPGYAQSFHKVFGGQDPVTVDNIVKAIAAYERTLITPDGPFDQYLRGSKKAISAQAQRGAQLLREVGCMNCHFGPNFSGPASPMGQGFFMEFPIHKDHEYVAKYKLLEDLGRYKATHQESDKHMFVVQTLRNIAITAPYFNNGSVGDLGTAVLVMAKTELNQDLTKEQVDDILAFLQTLTGKFPKQTMPRTPETPNTTLFMEFK